MLKEVYKIAALLGATVEEEHEEIFVEAPQGSVWACDGSHELISQYCCRTVYEACADLLTRMDDGTERCKDSRCEWCKAVLA